MENQQVFHELLKHEINNYIIFEKCIYLENSILLYIRNILIIVYEILNSKFSEMFILLKICFFICIVVKNL